MITRSRIFITSCVAALALAALATVGVIVHGGSDKGRYDDRAGMSDENRFVETFLELSRDVSDRNITHLDLVRSYRFHLAVQLATDPSLTAGQRNLVLDTIENANPQVVAKSGDKSGGQLMELLKPNQEALNTEFSDSDRDIFKLAPLNKQQMEMLATYKQVTASPYEYRRRDVFRSLSPAGKSQAFIGHICMEIATRELNRDQLELLSRAAETATPELYRKRGDKVPNDLERFRETAGRIFPKSVAADVFASMEGMAGKPIPERDAVLGVAKGGLAAFDAPNCSCSTESDYCGYSKKGAVCGGQAASCGYQYGGCGTLWRYDCDSMCFGGDLEIS